MDENKKPQVMKDEKYFQELRQRINEKAENLLGIKWLAQGNTKKSRISLAILVALIVVLEIVFYGKTDFWPMNAFIGGGAIVMIILSIIMRHIHTRMKNVSTVLQHYRALKQFINTHKLRLGAPLAVAIICWYLVKFGFDFRTEPIIILLILGGAWVFFRNFGLSYNNWYLDDDFSNDVKELSNYVDEMVDPD